MKNKNQNYRFTKKSPKSKLSEVRKENNHNDYLFIYIYLT